jgi:hypothetical protein
MPAFDFARNVSLNSLLNASTSGSFNNSYQIALLTVQADPQDTSATLAAKEPSGYNYSRITTSAGMWLTPISGSTNAQPCGHGVVENNYPLSFPQASGTLSGSWGLVIQTAILGQVSGAASGQGYSPLFYGPVRPETNVNAYSQPVTFGQGTYHMEIEGHNFADTTRDQIMQGYFGGLATNLVPSNYYLSLLTTLPEPGSLTSGTGLKEVTVPGVNNYARVLVANNTTNFTLATQGINYNALPFTFNAPTGIWGTLPVTAWALMDATSGGTPWFYGELNPVIPPIGGFSPPPTIQAGQMQVSLDALV